MGLSLHSALTIQGNDVNVETYFNRERIKYGFIISRMERDNYRMIVSTPVNANIGYNSKKEAQKAGEGLVKLVKEMDLSSQIFNLKKNLDNQESKTISEITRTTSDSNP